MRKLIKGKYSYLAKNSLYFTISSFGSKLLSILLIPIYTAVLSTAEMGLTDIAITTSSLLVYVVTLCIGDAVFVFSINKDDDEKKLFKYGLVFVTKGILLVTVFISFFSIFNPFGWPKYLYLFLWFQLCINSFTTVVSAYIRAIDKVKEIAISSFISTAVTIASNLFVLIVLKWGMPGYLISITIGPFVALVYLIFKCEGLTDVIKGSLCDKDVQREMLKYGIPLVINGISWWINGSLDRYFVTIISGASRNGIYSVASKIPTILSTLNVIFAQAWSISAIKEFDKTDEDGFFRKTYNGYNLSLLLCSSILIMINIPLAKMLFSNDFFQAWKSSSWLIASVLFNSMASFVGSIYGAVKNSKAYATTTIWAALFNVMLNLILIPKYQEVGAAIATMSSFFWMWLIRYLYSRKFITWRINIIRDLSAYSILIIQILLEQSEINIIFQLLCLIIIIILYLDVIVEVISGVRKKNQDNLI